jgi:hypothetical protein
MMCASARDVVACGGDIRKVKIGDGENRRRKRKKIRRREDKNERKKGCKI